MAHMDFHFCHLSITIWQVWGFFFRLLGGRRDMLVSSQVYKLNHIVKINTLERFFDNIRDSRGKWKLVIAQVFEHQHHECGGDHRDCGFYLILHPWTSSKRLLLGTTWDVPAHCMWQSCLWRLHLSFLGEHLSAVQVAVHFTPVNGSVGRQSFGFSLSLIVEHNSHVS